MGTVRKLSAVDSAPNHGLGQYVPSTPLNVLSRQVAFTYCRMSLQGADSVTDVVAIVDPDNCIRDDDDKRRYIPRMWHHVANGVFRFSEDQLAKMEKAAPGTVATLKHVFWRLLADEPPARTELLGAIRQLPNAFVSLLLRNPSPRTGYVGVKAIDDYELFGIESLGSLDAVAALLAASHLHEKIGHTETMLDTARSGIRLFLRIALSGPLAHHLEQIWPFLERRYVARLELSDLKSYRLIQDNYRVAVRLGGKLTTFGELFDPHTDFLGLADRWYFGNVLFLLKEIVPKLGRNFEVEQCPGLLQVLMAHYEEFSMHTIDPLLNPGPYPREAFEELDKSMSRHMPKYSRLLWHPDQEPEYEYEDPYSDPKY